MDHFIFYIIPKKLTNYRRNKVLCCTFSEHYLQMDHFTFQAFKLSAVNAEFARVESVGKEKERSQFSKNYSSIHVYRLLLRYPSWKRIGDDFWPLYSNISLEGENQRVAKQVFLIRIML